LDDNAKLLLGLIFLGLLFIVTLFITSNVHDYAIQSKAMENGYVQSTIEGSSRIVWVKSEH
jgi:hypothetical protein